MPNLFLPLITHPNISMADFLNKIIGLMSKEEQRNYKLYALRSHEDDDRKDLQLFDLIRKEGESFQDKKAMRSLYGKQARPNTYHRLCNRLLQEVGKSIALLHWDKEDTIAALHELTLAMLYRKKQEYSIAEYYLSRVERRIENLDLPELLDIVHGEFIGLSLELPDINPEVYVQKRTENRRRLNQLWQIDNLLAIVNHRLRRSQNLGKGDATVLHILQKTVDEFSLDPILMADPKFRFRMYDAVSKILLEQRDYIALESYLMDTFETFSSEGLFNKGNHEVKLQMLTYIINTLFKNGKSADSLAYAEKLASAMEQFGGIYRNKYEFFYYNSLFLNYSGTDVGRAIEVLEQMQHVESIIAVPQLFNFIYPNLALMEYTRKNYRAAIRHLVKLRMHEALQVADEGFRLRIDIFEMALRLDLRDHDTLEYRLQQVRHDYAALLSSEAMVKDSAMLNLIARINAHQSDRKDERLAEDIQAFLTRFPPDDTELFKYAEFLKNW